MNCYNRKLILMKFVDPGVLQLSSLADDFKKDQLLLIQWLNLDSSWMYTWHQSHQGRRLQTSFCQTVCVDYDQTHSCMEVLPILVSINLAQSLMSPDQHTCSFIRDHHLNHYHSLTVVRMILDREGKGLDNDVTGILSFLNLMDDLAWKWDPHMRMLRA